MFANYFKTLTTHAEGHAESVESKISQHLHWTLNREDWVFALEDSTKRIYTDDAKRRLLKTIKDEYAALKEAEEKGEFNKLENSPASIYLAESRKLVKDYYIIEEDIFKPSKVVLSEEKVISTILPEVEEIKSLPLTKHLRINRFFDPAVTSFTSFFPKDIAKIVVEYAMNKHDIKFLSEIEAARQKIHAKFNFDKNLEIVKQLIYPYFDMTFNISYIMFALNLKAVMPNSYLIKLSHQQHNVIELGHIYLFLPTVIKTHSDLDKFKTLKAYIGKSNFDLEIIELFNILFKQMLPKLPEKFNSNIKTIPFSSTDDYDNFILNQYNEYLSIPLNADLNKDNYQLFLKDKLYSMWDPLKQLCLIHLVWQTIKNSGVLISEFYIFLSEEAKNGLHAASAWIVSPGLQNARNKPNNENQLCHEIFELFPMKDLFLFIRHSIEFRMGYIGQYFEDFVKALMKHLLMPNPADDLVTHLLYNFTGNHVNDNIPLIKIQFLILQTVNTHQPDLMQQLTPIKIDLRNSISALLENKDTSSLIENYCKDIFNKLDEMDASVSHVRKFSR